VWSLRYLQEQGRRGAAHGGVAFGESPQSSEPNELSRNPFKLDEGLETGEGPNDVSENGVGAGGSAGGTVGGCGGSIGPLGSGYGIPTSLKVEPFDL
jgi:hypothetical protein